MKTETRAEQPATMVTKYIQTISLVLANSLLEWVLIVLLLLNSLFSYLIRRYANYFGLQPPCPWCSSVDRLFEPSKRTDPYRNLVCDSHASEVSKLAYCTKHKKLVESQGTCKDCWFSQPLAYENEEKRSKCSCCEKTLSRNLQCQGSSLSQEKFKGREIEIEEQTEKPADCKRIGSQSEQQVLSDAGSFYLREATEDSNEDEEIESGEIQNCDPTKEDETEVPVYVSVSDEKPNHPVLPDVVEEALSEQDNDEGAERRENVTTEQEIFHIERKAGMLKSDIDVEAFFIIQKLRCDLDAERKARQELYAELEAERNAAGTAANETMAMITRLQEEKATMQMEAFQYQRVMEEQTQYDLEALRLLNERLAKRENEKIELEKELEVYHKRVSAYEAKEKEKMVMIDTSGSSFSSDSETDVLSIDLCRHYDEDEDRKDVSLLECSNQWGFIEDSLEELEEERLSIIKQLKELDEKLNDEVEETEMKRQEPHAVECAQDVNLDTACFSNEVVTVEHAQTMASTARKLLDLVGSSDDDERDNEELTVDNKLVVSQVEIGGERMAMENEITHVYGRLQALEADTEFLRHCVGSLNKGNQGVNLLHEILVHLRELRASEICL